MDYFRSITKSNDNKGGRGRNEPATPAPGTHAQASAQDRAAEPLEAEGDSLRRAADERLIEGETIIDETMSGLGPEEGGNPAPLQSGAPTGASSVATAPTGNTGQQTGQGFDLGNLSLASTGTGSAKQSGKAPVKRRTFADMEREVTGRRQAKEDAAKRMRTTPQEPSKKDGSAMDIDQSAAASSPAPAVQTQTPKVPQPEEEIWRFATFEPFRAQPCAVEVEGSESVKLGWMKPAEDTSGLRLKVRVDPGKLGCPKLTIQLSSKPTKHLSTREEQQAYAALDETVAQVAFHPGMPAVMQDNTGLQQMDGLHIDLLSNHIERQGTESVPKPILDGTSEIERNQVIRIAFTANEAIVHNWDRALFASAYGETIAEQLGCIFRESSPQSFTIWYMIPQNAKDIDDYKNRCLAPFVRAFMEQKPNYHQYYNKANELILDLENTKSIHEVGNGMYKRSSKSGQEVSHAQIPLQTEWLAPEEFQLFSMLPVIREYQFQIGTYSELTERPQDVFIKRIPTFGVTGGTATDYKRIGEEERFLQDCSIWYTRLGSKKLAEALIPTEGTRIIAYETNPAQLTQETAKRSRQHQGVVIRVPKEDLHTVGADFAILMHRPKDGQSLRGFKKLEKKKTHELTSVWLKVEVDKESARRELTAVSKAFLPNATKQLKEICDVMFNRTGNVPVGKVNAFSDANGKDEISGKYIEHLRPQRYDAQIHALEQVAGKLSPSVKAKRSASCLSIIVGPSGAGKTVVCEDTIWGLHMADKKQLIVAAGNVPVDNLLKRLWCNQSTQTHKKPKMLRIVNGGLALQQILQQHRAKNSQAEEEAEWETHVGYSQELAKIFENMVPEDEYDAFKAKRAEYMDAYDAMLSMRGGRAHDFPMDCSLEYHINRILKEDEEKVSAKDKELARKDINYTPSEPAKYRTESAEYRQKLDVYVANKGSMPRRDLDEFFLLRKDMETRVLKEMDMVFCTANYSAVLGGRGFKPDVIHFDEIGQSSIATFFVPLTTFTSWKAVYVYGDAQQLQPIILSNQFNEVLENSKLSPLKLLQVKGSDYVFLNIQYRMTPALAKFPSERFYAGKLLNADVVKQVRPYSQLVQAVSQEHYGLKDGSEYFVVSVANGRSRLETGGNSVQNYANAKAICICIGHLVEAGIPEAKIAVVSFYKGQMTPMSIKIKQVSDGEWSFGQWATVDSYQGQEADVVLLDLVAANAVVDGGPAGSVEDPLTPGNVKGRASGHVTDPHRLNVGLTRGRSACIVFCQEATCLAVAEEAGASEKRKATAAMIQDAWKRKCLVRLEDIEDDHPDAIAESVRIGRKAQKERQANQYMKRMAFVHRIRTRQGEPRKTKPIKDSEADFYRQASLAAYATPVKKMQRVKRSAPEQTADVDMEAQQERQQDPPPPKEDWADQVESEIAAKNLAEASQGDTMDTGGQ